MNLIFLDIDGVLNKHLRLESGYTGFDPHCVTYFNELLDAVPDAQIIITSAWRYLILQKDVTLTGFQRILEIGGVKAKGRIRGYTQSDEATCPNLPAYNDVEAWSTIGLNLRVNQIMQYYAHLPESPLPFVVLDDLDLQFSSFQDRFVQTDPDVGLTHSLMRKAVSILKNQIRKENANYSLDERV